jgi:hypothetical protein
MNNNDVRRLTIKKKTIDDNAKNKKLSNSQRYSLIHIDANNCRRIKSSNSTFILDYYDYETAILHDKRNFLRLFSICILAKENIINIILFHTPLDLRSLRISLFIFSYSCDLAFNTLFYSNQNISDKYHYKGDYLYLFTLINNFVISIISSLVGMLIVNLFQFLIDSRGSFEDIFKSEEKKMRKNKKYKVNQEIKKQILNNVKIILSKSKIKIIIFIILEFAMMLFFFYFVTAFCQVYSKTQISWLFDCFNSFIISLVSEIGGALIIAIFYRVSITYKLKFVYNMAVFFYNL